MLRREADAQEKTITLYDSNFLGLAVVLDVHSYPLTRFSVPDTGVRVPVGAAKKYLPGLLDVAFALVDNLKADPGLLERIFFYDDNPCRDCETPDCDSCGRSYR